METVKNAPIGLRQFLEFACYKAWNVACVGLVWKAWGLDIGGCLAVYSIDLGMCYREYCPQMYGPIIPCWPFCNEY